MDPLTAMKIIMCKDEAYQTYLIYKELQPNNHVPPPKKTFWEVLRPLGLKDMQNLYTRVCQFHEMKYKRRLKKCSYTFSSLNAYAREIVLHPILRDFVCSQTKQERHPTVTIELYPKMSRKPHLIQGPYQDKWMYRLQMDIRYGFIVREKQLLIVNRLNRKIVGGMSKWKGKQKYLELILLPEEIEIKEGEKIW